MKVRPWYALPEADRQRAMDEHIRIGREEFPGIKNHTTYSFGIDDQEFMTAFECDEPADFMHLMLRLRDSEATRYTERDTPIFVGRRRRYPRRRSTRSTARAGRASRPDATLTTYVCWSRQVRHMAKPDAARTTDEGEESSPAAAHEPDGADVGDDQHRRAVEDDARARRPHRDPLALLAPHEEDEERDREQERDAREDQERRSASPRAGARRSPPAIAAMIANPRSVGLILLTGSG